MTTKLRPNRPLSQRASTSAVASPRFLLHGIDTIQCCYYLVVRGSPGIDFIQLRARRESLRDVRDPEPQPLTIGGMEFALAPYGSPSGYPIILSNSDFRIECGEHNIPSFFVTYRSEALWREPIEVLHQRFLDWAEAIGYAPAKLETLSRVDFCFDYYLPRVDFDEDSFVSLAQKDSQHRENGAVQTFTFGRDDVVLRFYDKVAEISQQSGKTWFFDLWGEDRDVWRIEWQVRKNVLRRFAILTFDDLRDQAGDVLRYLVAEHTTLRTPTADQNRSRRPLHALWRDLYAQIERFDAQGVHRVVDPGRAINERITRIGISLNGYLKQLAALYCIAEGMDFMSHADTLNRMQDLLRATHSPFSWRVDVVKRIKLIELGHG
jgi:hypothetical protein